MEEPASINAVESSHLNKPAEIRNNIHSRERQNYIQPSSLTISQQSIGRLQRLHDLRSIMAQSASIDTAGCPFLSIPAEMRNNIYELVLVPGNTVEETQLLEQKAPSKSLLLPCRQIHEEAKLLFRAEYRKFWRESKFVMTLQPPSDSGRCDQYFHLAYMALRGLGEANIAHITNLRINFDGPGSAWVLRDKVWFGTQSFEEEPDCMFLPRMHVDALEGEGYAVQIAGTLGIMEIEQNALIAVLIDTIPSGQAEALKSRARGIATTRKVILPEIMTILEDAKIDWDRHCALRAALSGEVGERRGAGGG